MYYPKFEKKKKVKLNVRFTEGRTINLTIVTVHLKTQTLFATVVSYSSPKNVTKYKIN